MTRSAALEPLSHDHHEGTSREPSLVFATGSYDESVRLWDLRAPAAYLGSACSGVCSKFVHTSSNKDRCPVNVCVWTSEGRRLLTGTHNGMFTLWSGLSFNFETTQQAHETAVRVAVWSHREEWMISGDL